MAQAIDHPQAFLYDEALPKPTTAVWLRHIAFLAIAFCTATIAGTLPPFGHRVDMPPLDSPIFENLSSSFSWLPTAYALYIVTVVYEILTNPKTLLFGLKFSVSLIFILICHEMGHYIACRIYKVDSTLPYFIPSLPLVGPAGTFGAFIRIRTRIPTRRAIFDIGVAGPIAGFIALLPVAIIAVATIEATSTAAPLPPESIVFSDPLLMKFLMYLFGVNPETASAVNPFYGAAWIGAIVTALNLIPSGQLDGGHAVYAVFGERIHYWFGRVAFAVMALLAIGGMVFYSSPAGVLFAVVLGVMMRVPHPEPWDHTTLDAKRKVIALLTLVIFILCFLPIPIYIA
jgi:membrane-associated protease RseP (regulator of RpoE activity)